MKQTYLSLLLFCFAFQIASAQQSNYEQWRAAVNRHIQAGTFDGFHAEDDIDDGLRLLEKNGAVCPEVDAGYGTNGWTPSSSPQTNNADPNCTIVDDLVSCNGGKYRIAFRNVIFECPSWNGTNYLETAQGGFLRLSDEDITARFVKLNELLAKANLELVEVERVRITDCDMYDYYFKRWGKDPRNGSSDGVNDETQLEAYEQPDMLNLFWVGGFNGRHDCCGPLGFIDKLPTPRNYGVMRYSVTMNKSSLEHDMGHFFGVYHPHWNLEAHENVKVGYPDGALNNSDCLTHGDGICDTWPGAALEYKCPEGCQVGTDELCYQGDNCSFNMNNYRCVNGHNLMIHPNDGVQIDEYTSTVLSNNLATYNGDDCRLTYTPCQYYKMNMIARTCRAHLCIQDHNAYFTASSDYQKRVGANQSIPVFTAGKVHTSFDGSSYNVDCFDWFLNEDDLAREAVAQSTSTFDPSPYVNGKGTYTFYIAEVNALNDPPCKLPVTLTITSDNTGGGDDGGGNDDGGDTGGDDDGDNGGDNGGDDNLDCNTPLPGITTSPTTVTLGSGESSIDLNVQNSTLGTNEVVAWWITKNSPASAQINNQGTLDNQIGNTRKDPTNDGSVIGASANAVWQASNVQDGLIVNCENLDPNSTYYATPFVATVEATTTGGGGGTANSCTGDFNYASSKHKGDPLRVAILKKNSISCATSDAPSYTLVVNVSNYTGSTEGFRMYIVHETSTKLVKLLQSGGNGTYIFTEDDLNGFDPNPEGLRVAVLEDDGDGGKDVELSASLTITYGDNGGGGDVVTTYTWSATYSDCLFGEAVAFSCANSLGGDIENRSNINSSAIVVYPSPAMDDVVYMDYESTTNTTAQIRVFNVDGKVQLEQAVQLSEGNNQLSLPIQALNAGVYMLNFTVDNEEHTVRFSKL